MSVQMSVASPDLQKQLELLKYYPEIATKHFRPAMEAAAPLAEAAVGALVPYVTGHLRQALGSKVLGAGLNVRAKVGFGAKYGKSFAPYAAPVNAGAGPHKIQPGTRRAGAKYLSVISPGRFTLSKVVEHPGFTGFHFMEGGLEAATPAINAIMTAANEAVVRELAVP